jgi:hypothetical protein
LGRDSTIPSFSFIPPPSLAFPLFDEEDGNHHLGRGWRLPYATADARASVTSSGGYSWRVKREDKKGSPLFLLIQTHLSDKRKYLKKKKKRGESLFSSLQKFF